MAGDPSFSFGENVSGFVPVPPTEGAFTAIEQAAPWRTRSVDFEADCLILRELRVCRSTS
jgi:hypothetical protein